MGEIDDPTGNGASGGEVLSNLPRTRPSVRSPRRDEPAPRPPRRRPAKGSAAKPAADTEPERNEASGPEGASGADQGGSPGLEDVARAGATAAYEAIGVGLRLGRWAARNLRDAVERR